LPRQHSLPYNHARSAEGPLEIGIISQLHHAMESNQLLATVSSEEQDHDRGERLAEVSVVADHARLSPPARGTLELTTMPGPDADVFRYPICIMGTLCSALVLCRDPDCTCFQLERRCYGVKLVV
jgi:hypothetical protein